LAPVMFIELMLSDAVPLLVSVVVIAGLEFR
jgi:hypothetical protein